MTDWLEQVPDRLTNTAISTVQLAALQRRLAREQPADPRDVGGLTLPVVEQQLPDTIKK